MKGNLFELLLAGTTKWVLKISRIMGRSCTRSGRRTKNPRISSILVVKHQILFVTHVSCFTWLCLPVPWKDLWFSPSVRLSHFVLALSGNAKKVSAQYWIEDKNIFSNYCHVMLGFFLYKLLWMYTGTKCTQVSSHIFPSSGLTNIKLLCIYFLAHPSIVL